MQVKGLPPEVSQYIDAALASGTYRSADELVCAALQFLRTHGPGQQAPVALAAVPPARALESPDDYLHALAQALRSGECGRARQVATEGAARYPEHAELSKSARILAPPTVTRASRPHTVDIRANRTWLQTHRQDYAGQWVAVRNGHFLAAASSFEALAAQIELTPDVLTTKLPA